MRRILYYLGLVDLVWTMDGTDDAEVRLRIVWNRDGKRCVAAIIFPADNQLGPKGTFIGEKSSYLKKWFPYNQRPNRKQKKWLLPFSRKQSQLIEVKERLEG